MRILFVGAAGVIGSRAIPMLLASGHEVHGSARTWVGQAKVRRLGAEPLQVDANDSDALAGAVAAVKPDVVVNMLTSLRTQPSFRRLDATMVPTNLLRTVATDVLVEAATDAGAKRYVGQSFAGWFSQPGTEAGGAPAPLLAEPPARTERTVAALRHLESAVTAAPGGVVLRFGPLYGKGAGMGTDGSVIEELHRRRVPIVGDGQGVWSFCHLQDAARAIVLAVESDATGTFEIVDDEPAPVSTWLPELAQAVGSPAPRHVPVWLAKPMIGDFGVHLMTRAAGASNAAAADALGYVPEYRSWREGFRTGLGS